MSSTRKPAAAGGPPPPERKAPTGPVITPSILIVVYFLALAIGAAVYWNNVVKKSQTDIAAAQARATSAQTQIQTYRTKGGKLAMAREMNRAVRDKLRNVSYQFLTDQSSMLPFWEYTFLPLLDASGLYATDDTKLKAHIYSFKVNMAMSPFETLPRSSLFEGISKFFPVDYQGERDGQPVDTPLDTRPPEFLMPYTITLEKFRGSYTDVKRFIENLQVKQEKTLFTVHCLKNDESKNAGIYRTHSDWDIVLTVYFINPEAQASGDAPPAPPGSESC